MNARRSVPSIHDVPVKSWHPSILGSGLTANGDDLPNGSRVVRYVGYAQMEKDENDQQILGPYPNAFARRSGEQELSVTWCEYFEGPGDQVLRCAVEAIRGSRSAGKNSQP